MNDQPFRWNLKNRRALDTMLANSMRVQSLKIPVSRTEDQKTYNKLTKLNESLVRQSEQFKTAISYEEKYKTEMLEACARILSYTEGYDLIFVGRSPESIFDLMSGLLEGTSLGEKLVLMQFSMRHYSLSKLDWQKSLSALKSYFTELKLDPGALAKRRKPVVFIDLVYTGQTFFNLLGLLRDWSLDENLEWKTVVKQIRLVGIVQRKKTSPNTFRWQQEDRFLELTNQSSVKNVSISRALWTHLGDKQKKTTPNFSPEKWNKTDAYLPSRNTTNLIGLSIALFWYDFGSLKDSKLALAGNLVSMPEMMNPVVRKLVQELRGK